MLHQEPPSSTDHADILFSPSCMVICRVRKELDGTIETRQERRVPWRNSRVGSISAPMLRLAGAVRLASESMLFLASIQYLANVSSQ
jgi:hypothetical protein